MPSNPLVPSFATRTLPFTPFCTQWIPSSARLLAIGHKASPRPQGVLHIYKLEMPPSDGKDEDREEGQAGRGELRLMVDITKEKAASLGRTGLKCGAFLGRGGGQGAVLQRHLALGDFEGRLSLWDIDGMGGERAEPLFAVEGHDKIVNAMDASTNLILSGITESREREEREREEGREVSDEGGASREQGWTSVRVGCAAEREASSLSH